MSSGPGNIIIRIGAQTADAVRDIGKVNSSLGDTMTTSQKATAGIKKAALPAAAALGAIGFAAVDATKAALEDAAAQDKLAHQLKRTTGATDAQIKSAEDYITKMEMQTGVSDDELRPALGKLATATGSVSKAQDALTLALDISAQTGKSLDTVSTALAKGYGGNTAALGKLVPGLDKATLATKDMTKITDELSRLTEGAASESAQTAAGQYKVWQVQMQELKETLGAALIPVVKQLGAVLISVTGFAAEHTTAIKVLVGAVAAVSAAILAANAAIKAYEAITIVVKAATAAWTAAQWLLNAALDANPIGIVVIAVGALGAALVLAYQKSETFRSIVKGALEAVEGAVDALKRAFNEMRNAAFLAWDWIQDHWKLALFALGPIGAAVYLISENFDKIKAAAVGAYNFVTGSWKLASFAFGPIETAVGAIGTAFGAIETAAKSAWNWIVSHFVKPDFDAIVAAINSITAAFHRVVDAIESVIGWIGRIHFPKLPGWIPHSLPGLSGLTYPAGMPVPAGYGVSSRASSSAGGVVVNVYGAVDPEGTARAINRILLQHNRRIGRAP